MFHNINRSLQNSFKATDLLMLMARLKISGKSAPVDLVIQARTLLNQQYSQEQQQKILQIMGMYISSEIGYKLDAIHTKLHDYHQKNSLPPCSKDLLTRHYHLFAQLKTN